MNIITGYIRPPTVKSDHIRLIANIGEDLEDFKKALEIIKRYA